MRERTRRSCLAAALGLLAAAGAARAEPALWQVSGGDATVYLFGSVHLLREGGFAVDGGLARALDDAERVCLELDPAAHDASESMQVTLARAIDPEGRSLFDLLGEDADEARERAEAAGVDLAPFATFEPWFAGVTVSLLALQQAGFDPEHGVERVIEAAAREAGKPLCGLETLDGQLALLDGMPAGSQAALLLQSLDEAADIESMIEPLLDAWQDGDLDALEEELEEDLADYPELADPLIFDRNARWADEVARMLEGEDDVLLVVGALHLVGERGLPALLEARGYRVTLR